MLTIYADESGTDGRSSAVVLAGYIASDEYWARFHYEWKAVLDKYDAPYFHFREFARRHKKEGERTPYHGWSESKSDDFLYELAMIVAEEAIPIDGFCPIEKPSQTGPARIPSERIIDEFTKRFYQVLSKNWPDYKDRINFVFDQNKNEKWLGPLNSAFKNLKNTDFRVNVSPPANMRKILPLQAADMNAYTLRQAVENYFNQTPGQVTSQSERVLDLILRRNREPKLKSIPFGIFKLVIEALRQDLRAQKSDWKAEEIKQNYYPSEHFPFEQHRVFSMDGEYTRTHIFLLAAQLSKTDQYPKNPV